LRQQLKNHIRTILFFFLLSLNHADIYPQQNYNFETLKSTPKSDVFLQGFYWNSTPGGIWYDSLAKLAPRLASAGFGAVWFPSPTKGMSGAWSMGYDPYDHYDFGEYNQQGGIETRFGSRQELINAISTYHSVGIQVWADAVINHMNGGERKQNYECKPYPSFPDSEYLQFYYPNGSGRFKKDSSYFYPNLQTCDVNQPYHGDPVYQFGVWLAHDRQKVKDSLIVWGQYLRNVLKFDGFRLDMAKHIDPIFMGPWLQNVNAGGYAVAEYYGGIDEIKTWLHYCQNVFGGDISMFDFPLRFDLKDMCNNTSGGYDMNWLDGAGLINNGVSGFDVATFADNHDFDRIGWDGNTDIGHSPIIYNKDLAYAYIIFSEGRPSVWFKDYFSYGLSGKIDTLIWIRQNILSGGTTKRSGLDPWYVGSSDNQVTQSRDIYVARRNGGSGKPAAYLVINDNPTQWRGVWVNSDYPNQVFRDYTGKAMDKTAAGDGRVELWAPPRGYAVYVPDTSTYINHPPYIQTIPDLKAFINTSFEYQTIYGDPNNNPVTFLLTGNPSWLSVTTSGKLIGTPAATDTGITQIILTISDSYSSSAHDTFLLTVQASPAMDGVFDGLGVWNHLTDADTIAGWAGAMVKDIFVSEDQNYFYFGANIKANQGMNWAFLINTKGGGGSTESWGRSINYNHPNLPDYILRGTFGSYAEFHTWTGSYWSGVGNALNISEFGENISADTIQSSWLEVRILKSSIGNPLVFAVQCYLTGNQTSNATFDACPNDENTTGWSGITTHLRYYAIEGNKTLTFCNLQHPQSSVIPGGGAVTVYARAFGIGVTDSTGQGTGVSAWIGYSTVNTNPATWTNWISAPYYTDVNNYDEYRTNIGVGLPGGVYYYASRFQYDGGNYFYGGYSGSGGGFWNGATASSGVLTINAAPEIPTLTSPANGDTAVNTIVTLSWNPVSGAASYRLQLSTDSTFTSIDVDDSTLTSAEKNVNGLTRDTFYYWRVRSKNGYGSSSWSERWNFKTRYDFTVDYYFSTAWNMVSLPLDVSDAIKSIVFPNASSDAFTFSPGSGYIKHDTLLLGKGYWLKFPAQDTVRISGIPISLDTVDVVAGWNMIGSVSVSIPTDSISQIPYGIIQSKFYTYEKGYIIAETIEPSKAYWVKCNTDGKLILFDEGKKKSEVDSQESRVRRK
jgi:alpha-amylase